MSASASLEDIRYSVLSWSSLKGWPSEAHAAELLQRAITVINVLLKRHRWTVVDVSEFYPNDRSLLGLNINQGEAIKVRLRRPVAASWRNAAPVSLAKGRKRGRGGGGDRGWRGSSDSSPIAAATSFFPFEEIMCTLIHEVVHNTISPHDASFFALYHKLVAECEGIIAEQQLAATVGGRGRALNGSNSGSASATTAVTPVPFAGAGRRLGGMIHATVTVREAVLRAQEQRRLSEVSCSLDGCALSQRQIQRQQQDLRNGLKGTSKSEHLQSAAVWRCHKCGLDNHPLLPFCEFCTATGGGAAQPHPIMNDNRREVVGGRLTHPPPRKGGSCLKPPADDNDDDDDDEEYKDMLFQSIAASLQTMIPQQQQRRASAVARQEDFDDEEDGQGGGVEDVMTKESFSPLMQSLSARYFPPPPLQVPGPAVDLAKEQHQHSTEVDPPPQSALSGSSDVKEGAAATPDPPCPAALSQPTSVNADVEEMSRESLQALMLLSSSSGRSIGAASTGAAVEKGPKKQQPKKRKAVGHDMGKKRTRDEEEVSVGDGGLKKGPPLTKGPPPRRTLFTSIRQIPLRPAPTAATAPTHSDKPTISTNSIHRPASHSIFSNKDIKQQGSAATGGVLRSPMKDNASMIDLTEE